LTGTRREPRTRTPGPDLDTLERGVIAGDRSMLARSITLLESSAQPHRELAERLLTRLMPRTGGSVRIGITGAPGAGKSTFIECLGSHLTSQGKRVAVLAIDPSSGVTGGSILGDKTRMERLSADPDAFIRPSPTSGTLGGVARTTRETVLVCEAAGFDAVLVETVGVGQSETVVAEMTDFLLALMIPGAGDELQGIKRGLLELVDMIVVNKADGETEPAARRAAAEFRGVLRSGSGEREGRTPSVVLCSAKTGAGIPELWSGIEHELDELRRDGRLEGTRRRQMVRWMWSVVDESLRDAARRDPRFEAARSEALEAVARGMALPGLAARRLVDTITGAPQDENKPV